MKKIDWVFIMILPAVVVFLTLTTGDSSHDEEGIRFMKEFLTGFFWSVICGAIMGIIIGAIRALVKKDMLFMISSIVAGVRSWLLGFILALAIFKISERVFPYNDGNVVNFFCLIALVCMIIINTTYDLVKGEDSDYYESAKEWLKILK